MAAPHLPPLLLLLFSISISISISDAIPLHRPHLSALDLPLLHHSTAPPPTTYFEVTRPIPVPAAATACSALLLHHDFAFTYGKAPVTAPYSFPSHCPRSPAPSRVVLEWSATCQGRQFDRIFGVWLAGVELLRSCTAEPRASGIFWSVRKDVTRFSSLFSRNSTLAVYLGNLVDSTYTGIYHVNVSIHYYFDAAARGPARLHLPACFDSPADLILPVSRSPPLNDGLWFLIQNSTDVQSKQLAIPSNTYRAVLEVFVSFHSDDEFWYTNPPNAYIEENNLTNVPGNGPFREVLVSVDGDLVGAIWPFTVIYTGGINPLLWRPITGIGSFDLPSYNIDITPFLGKILDGKSHEFGFGVTNALDVWYIDANLHLWLDHKNEHVVGKLIKYKAPSLKTSLDLKFKGLDGVFKTKASRETSATGWVKSSYGKITTHFFQKFEYENLMVYSANASVQVINQTIETNYGTYAKHPSSGLYSDQVFQSFPLYLFTGTADQVNDSYSLVSNVSFGFNEKMLRGQQVGFSFSSLRNSQEAQGVMRVKGNLVTSGIGSTQQLYRYDSTEGCYFRNVSSSNYTILHDESGNSCPTSSLSGYGYMFGRWLPFSSRRASLAWFSLQNGD